MKSSRDRMSRSPVDQSKRQGMHAAAFTHPRQIFKPGLVAHDHGPYFEVAKDVWSLSHIDLCEQA